MIKVLDKKLLRGVWNAWGQALAVAAVISCGTASLICVTAAHENLVLTRDAYYAQYRYADFNIMLERAPLTAVSKLDAIPGVRDVRGRIVKDVNVDIEGVEEPRVGRVISMPDRPEPVVNGVRIMTGRYFDKGASNEVILSDSFARENGLGAGDAIQAAINDKKHTLRIVGTGMSPEYVYMIRNAQEMIPSPGRFGILWVPQTFAELAFDMNEACNDVVGTVDDRSRLERVLERADDLLEPYGVFAKLERDDMISYRFLADEIRGLEISAKITPTIFLGIASLILLILLNRMVRHERTQIGLMKAYGYSNAAVSFHYVKFALLLTLVGCAGGFALGQWLAGKMTELYVEFYHLPLTRMRMYPDVLAKSMGVTLVFGLLGAVSAARRAARIQPAEAMRPKAPRSGHRTGLERVAVIWRNLSFTWKMIVRNVSRYRFRASLTVFGVMVSSGIMIIGFFTMDAMDYLLEFQFEKTQLEDVKIALVTERGKPALHEISRFDYVRHAEPLLQYPFEIRTRWREKDVGVIGVPQEAELIALLDDEGRRVRVGDRGLMLTERLARDLGVAPGGVVVMKPLMGRIKREYDVPVSKVVRQYMGMSAYMNLDALSRLLDEPFAMNTALVRTERGRENDLTRILKDVTGVASVEVKQHAYESLVETLAESMNIMNTILAVFSGVIAFAIIYNTTVVSLAERQRELASLRVMGFTKREVGRIMYHENFLLSALGLAAGYPFGVGICRIVVRAYDTELYRLPFHIEPTTYVRTALMTVVFVLLANLAVWRKIARLDMVEVLKSRE